MKTASSSVKMLARNLAEKNNFTYIYGKDEYKYKQPKVQVGETQQAKRE